MAVRDPILNPSCSCPDPEKKWLPRTVFSHHNAIHYRMCNVALTAPSPAAETTKPAAEIPRTVARPKKGVFKLIGEVLSHGGPGYLQFAITNICNARCDFCGFAVDRFDPKQRRSVTLEEAKDAIEIARRNHIGYLLFVRAEPLVHKEIRAMLRHAAEQWIPRMISTNGSFGADQIMRELADECLTRVRRSIV